MSRSFKSLIAASLSSLLLAGCATGDVIGSAGEAMKGTAGNAIGGAVGNVLGDEGSDAVASGLDAADMLGGGGDMSSLRASASGRATGGAASLASEGLENAFQSMSGEPDVSFEDVQAMSQEIKASDPYEVDGRQCIDYEIVIEDAPNASDDTEQSFTACQKGSGWEVVGN